MIQFFRKIFGLGPKTDFKELLRNGATIIDVRTKAEFRDGHIKGAINIPLDTLGTNISGLNKDKTIITCCASGMRSASAKGILKSKGFKDVHNGGGWMTLKRAMLLLITTATVLFNSCTNGQSQTSSANLSAVEFSDKIKQTPEAVVIDARTPDEFSKGHLVNAKNMDWNGGDFQNQISGLNKSQPVFIYCLSGARSASAAKKMRADGFKEVYELSGGIMKWRAANLPETTEEANSAGGLTMAQFNELLNTDKIVLIDFYATWCAPCKRMEPYLAEIATEMKDTVAVIRIDADDNQQLCKELKIDALPVLLLYKNKNLTWKNNGYIGKEDVLKHLNE